MRLLGTVRLSHMTAETLSPVVQREKISGYAKLYGHVIVGWAEDVDVSGAVSVWARDLAPWLQDPELVGQWDAVIVAKLDRLTRSIVDFGKFIEWCNSHGKTVISVAENLDFSTASGRLFAGILVMFAQFERERMGERRRDRYQADKARGWWGGGWTKYGFRAVPVDLPTPHYELADDPEEKKIVYRMARDILSGKSATQIARELTADGIPTKRGGKWASTVIYDILRDPESVLGTNTWKQLQPVISAAERPKVNRYNASLLSGIAVCGKCGAEMWAQHTKTRGQVWHYYRCFAKCGAKMIRAADLEASVNEAMTEDLGKQRFMTRRRIPGNNRQYLLDQAERQMAELNARFTARAIQRAEYRAKLDILLDEQERAEAMPIVPDKYERVDSGMTVAQWWTTLDEQAKRHELMRLGWKVAALAPEHRGGEPLVVMVLPPKEGQTLMPIPEMVSRILAREAQIPKKDS